MSEPEEPKVTFHDFPLHPNLMKGVDQMGYVHPTDVQRESIPVVLEGKDMIVNAQTGSGKTAAFLIPLIHRNIDKPTGKTRVLILAPTRELASQIDDNGVGLAYYTSVKITSVYGGVPMPMQEQALKSGCTIIAATPGRLLDHAKYGNCLFDEVETFVLDEADRMLDMGFWPDVEQIVKRLIGRKQTLLFSATMPEPIVKLSSRIMKDPVRIKVGRQVPPSQITQVFYPVAPSLKSKLLLHILREDHMKSVIVFVKTKIGADRLGRQLQRSRFETGIIHGDRTQESRIDTLNRFKHGQLQILVATDVAARGIDIEGVSHVVNYDIPHDVESYIHRIGRTARKGTVGDAMTLVAPEDEDLAAQVERMIGRDIPRKIVEAYTPRHEPRHHTSHSKGHHKPQHRRHGGPSSNRRGSSKPKRHGAHPQRGHRGQR